MTWYGRDIQEMTHEELLDAFEQLAEMYRLATENHIKNWDRFTRLKDRAPSARSSEG